MGLSDKELLEIAQRWWDLIFFFLKKEGCRPIHQAEFSISQCRTWKFHQNKVRLWSHDARYFVWHIPRGQSWVFRQMRNRGMLLSSHLPMTFFLCVPHCQLQYMKVQGQSCGLWLSMRVFILCPVLSFAGLEAVLKTVEPCGRGEELPFSGALIYPWNTACQPLPAVLLPYSGDVPKPASSVWVTSSRKAVVKHPLLGSQWSDK